MIFTDEIKGLLELRVEPFLVKDDKGILSKAEAGKKGEIITSDQIDDVIFLKLFGNGKMVDADLKNLNTIVKIFKEKSGLKQTRSKSKRGRPLKRQ